LFKTLTETQHIGNNIIWFGAGTNSYTAKQYYYSTEADCGNVNQLQ